MDGVGRPKYLQDGSRRLGVKREVRYTIEVKDHKTGQGFKVELFSDIYLASARKYLVEVDGKPSERLPVASKTKVLDIIRRWLVAH